MILSDTGSATCMKIKLHLNELWIPTHKPKPNPTCTQNQFQFVRWVRKIHLALEFFKTGSVGNMVWTRSCQDRVRFLIPSWTATWKLMKTDLTAGFGERFMTVTDRYCFAVYRKRLHVAIIALKFKVKFVGEPLKLMPILRMLVTHFAILSLNRCSWRFF